MAPTTEQEQQQQLQAIQKREKKERKRLAKQRLQQQQQQQHHLADIVVDPILLAPPTSIETHEKEGDNEEDTKERQKKKKKKSSKKDKKRMRDEEEASPDHETTTTNDDTLQPSKKKTKLYPLASTSILPTPSTDLPSLSEKELKKQKKREAKALLRKSSMQNDISVAGEDVMEEGEVDEEDDDEVREKKKHKKDKKNKKKKSKDIFDSDLPVASTSASSTSASMEDHLKEKIMRKTSRKEARKLQKLAMAAIQVSSNLNGNEKGDDSSDTEHGDEDEDEAENSSHAPTSGSKLKSRLTSKSNGKEESKESKERKKARSTMPTRESFGNLTPQEIISTKWLSSAQLKKLEEEYGFTLKSGKFSLSEDAQLRSSISAFASSHSLSPSEIKQIIYSPATTKFSSSFPSSSPHSSFWTTITLSLNQNNYRSLLSVFNRVRRLYDEEGKTGPWTEEEVKLLKSAYAEYGTRWAEVAKRVGRKPDLCRARWLLEEEKEKDKELNHKKKVGSSTSEDEEKVGGDGTGRGGTGKWTKEEKESLKEAVNELGENWTSVAKKVAGRSAKQCMEVWKNSVTLRDNTPSWESIHRVILLHTIAKLNVSDVSEFEWRTIPEVEKRLEGFSSAMLRKAWTRLILIAKKNGIEGFKDQVDYLVRLIPEDSTSVPKIKTPNNVISGTSLSKSKAFNKIAKGKGKENAQDGQNADDIMIDSATISAMNGSSAMSKGKGKEKEYKSTELVDSDDEDSSSSGSDDEVGSDDSE